MYTILTNYNDHVYTTCMKWNDNDNVYTIRVTVRGAKQHGTLLSFITLYLHSPANLWPDHSPMKIGFSHTQQDTRPFYEGKNV